MLRRGLGVGYRVFAGSECMYLFPPQVSSSPVQSISRVASVLLLADPVLFAHDHTYSLPAIASSILIFFSFSIHS